MNYLLGLTILSALTAMLIWRRHKRLEFDTVVDRRLLAISARAQVENPNFESYR